MPLDNLPSHPKIVTPVDTLWHVSKILAHLQCFTFHGNTFSRGEAPNWRTLTSFTKLLPKITSKIRGEGHFPIGSLLEETLTCHAACKLFKKPGNEALVRRRGDAAALESLMLL